MIYSLGDLTCINISFTRLNIIPYLNLLYLTVHYINSTTWNHFILLLFLYFSHSSFTSPSFSCSYLFAAHELFALPSSLLTSFFPFIFVAFLLLLPLAVPPPPLPIKFTPDTS